jgi:guanylate kinase
MVVSVPVERLGVLFALVGPGGVGKNALMNAVLEQVDGLSQLPTATTREIRTGEQQGREHLFVSRDEFERMIVNNELLEYQEVHPGKFYGVPRQTVERAIREGRDLIADIEVLGARIIRKAYPENSVTVFIAPPSVQALVDRLNNRQASEQELEERLDRLPMEMRFAPLCDHVIVNDDVAAAAEDLRSVIEATQAGKDVALQKQRLSLGVVVLPTFENDVLRRDNSDARELRVDLAHQSQIETVAAAALRDALNIEPDPDRLKFAIPNGGVPLRIQYEPDQNAYDLQYVFSYLLPERIEAPSGWHWEPYSEQGVEQEA